MLSILFQKRGKWYRLGMHCHQSAFNIYLVLHVNDISLDKQTLVVGWCLSVGLNWILVETDVSYQKRDGIPCHHSSTVSHRSQGLQMPISWISMKLTFPVLQASRLDILGDIVSNCVIGIITIVVTFVVRIVDLGGLNHSVVVSVLMAVMDDLVIISLHNMFCSYL